MYVNMHTLPPGYEMFTLYLNIRGTDIREVEEYDAVVPVHTGVHEWVVGTVIEHVRDDVVSLFGPNVQVMGMINQSTAEVVFNSQLKGQVPLPVVIPPNMVGCTRVPYDLLLSLVPDAIRGECAYRDWLLEVAK